MKKVMFILFLVTPFSLFAQNPLGINEGSLQNLNQSLQHLQSCMTGIDPTALLSIQKEAQQLKREIDTLCRNKKRHEAQAKAIASSKALMTNPVIQKFKQCGQSITEIASSEAYLSALQKTGASKQHICDL